MVWPFTEEKGMFSGGIPIPQEIIAVLPPQTLLTPPQGAGEPDAEGEPLPTGTPSPAGGSEGEPWAESGAAPGEGKPKLLPWIIGVGAGAVLLVTGAIVTVGGVLYFTRKPKRKRRRR